ncbi:MAG: sulfatase [Candidatus Solibacter sp.]|nr:sulfatase [Candidatus Solibacter sp.]
MAEAYVTNRRQFLATASLNAVAARGVLGSPTDRPSVLFILADEWRAQATGYNADPNARTPVLDRLAGESVNFQNAVSGTPVCCPYRASLLTGQYPLTNGVFINDVELKPKGVTWGESFARAGYQTGYIGKWHVYGSPDGQYGRRLAYIPPEKRFGFAYWKACECSHEYNHSLYYQDNDPTPRYWPGYDAMAQTDDACAFIERQAKARDAYSLVLSLGPPHFPYATAPAKHRALYEGRPIQLRPNVPPEHRAEAIEILRGYYAHIAALDDCLERLLGTLERTGTAENTIVVFTSDHGDMMRSQGLTTKLYPWDESVRVPFLVRYPRRFGKKTRAAASPLNSPDILPTLLGLCGLAIPDGVEGTDFSRAADGHGDANGRGALLSLPVPITEARKFGFAEYRGLRTGRYTYARSIAGPWLLYDNRQDPYQIHNLCGQSKHRDTQSRLDRDLNAMLKERKDEFLPAREYVSRAGLGHYREVNVPVGQVKSPWGDWESTMAPELAK